MVSNLLVANLLAEGNKVEIKGTYKNWQMTLNGQPFYVKGVCFAHNIEEATIDGHITEVKKIGANSVRTWGVGPDTIWLLNAAAKQGIYVDVGIWLENRNKINYAIDTRYKREVLMRTKNIILQYKDHPAVLMWNIGNEVDIGMNKTEDKIAFAKFLEEVCKMVHEVDPNHPIVSTFASTLAWSELSEWTPSLDIYGVNVYGGIYAVQEQWEQKKYNKPYLITEFGTIGEWEVAKDEKGLLREPDDNQKVKWYKGSWDEYIYPNKGSNFGAYVFAFGGPEEDFIGLWLNVLVSDKKRPIYWAVYEMFTGKKPENRPPRILTIVLEKDIVKPRENFSVQIFAKDRENDTLDYNVKISNKDIWGGRIKVAKFEKKEGNKLVIEAPPNPGLYKFYFYVLDDKGNINVANRSILCAEEPTKLTKIEHLRKTIAVSESSASSFVGINSPDKAVDGDKTTSWESEWADPQWIKIDLGSQKNIDTVILKWDDSSYGKSYKIQVSNNNKDWTDVHSTTKGKGEVDKINFPTQNVRYVRMYGTERGTIWGYSLWEFELYDKSQSAKIEIAKVVASSVQEEGFETEKAFDENSETRWSSAWKDGEWIYADFGKAKTFNTIVLKWEAAYGRYYEIQTSDDADNWKTVYSIRKGDGGDDVIYLGKQTARYVKMQGVRRGAGWGYSLWEFEIYNEASSGVPKVVASSVLQVGMEAERAFDKDSTTMWASNFKNPNEWIYIDFGSPKEFSDILLNWDVNFGKAYEIQISDDADKWTTIYSTDKGKGGKDVIPVGKQKTRYVKMNGVEKGGYEGYSLQEFEVK